MKILSFKNFINESKYPKYPEMSVQFEKVLRQYIKAKYTGDSVEDSLRVQLVNLSYEEFMQNVDATIAYGFKDGKSMNVIAVFILTHNMEDADLLRAIVRQM
jgi:hypothetical protein